METTTMKVIEESREFIKQYGSEKTAQLHALKMYDELNIKKYEMYYKLMQPGNLYTFKYFDISLPFKLTTGQIPYCDLHPYGLLLSINDKEIRLLNLNVVPLKARERLFILMEKLYRNTISYNANNEKSHVWRKIPITEALIAKHIPFDYSIAVNIYNTKYVRKVDALDWSNLHILMSLSFDKKLFFNKGKLINKRTIARKILSNQRNEKIIK